ncbi:hypothetical protein LEP1GSC047_4182 [Leptospira inadai serovar Lyme str. 10]|uniref:Uncharacterized protein n=1 Tax=Leptospira inadai serovar Lyme str. 10 TaxID=1049790 RepID=V6HKC2_9LEPT|nr:hypothetical protein LEP1GSC047_4182 [Leptospira inadai serovar Lyme str. 10]
MEFLAKRKFGKDRTDRFSIFYDSLNVFLFSEDRMLGHSCMSLPCDSNSRI